MADDTHLLGDGVSETERNYADFPRQTETSIVLVIKAAVKQEESLSGYIKHVFVFFKNSSTFLMTRAVMLVAAIAIFVVGLIRYRHCDLEPEIPLFLILEGAAIVIKTCIFMLRMCNSRAPEEGERSTLDTCNDITSLFVVLWTLSGSVWVFGTYSRVNMVSEEESDYCDKLVYLCSLAFLLFVYIYAVAMVIFTIVLCAYYAKQKHEQKNQHPYDTFA